MAFARRLIRALGVSNEVKIEIVRYALKVLSCLCIMMTFTILAQAKEWRGIIPLKSTRADVERLLGPSSSEVLPIYQLPDESVTIFYAKGRPCPEKTVFEQWNVPTGTVIVISVRPKESVLLSTLKLDLTKFKKMRGDNDLPDDFYYMDEVEGFGIGVFESNDDAVVATYYYEPTAEERSRHSRCPKNLVLPDDPNLPSKCPDFIPECPDMEFEVGSLLEVGVIPRAHPEDKPLYYWTVSAGKIIRGQGTSSITIDTKGLKDKCVVATVEVGGLAPSCHSILTCTVPLKPSQNVGKSKLKGKP